MTNGSPNTPPEPPESSPFLTRIQQFIRKPSTLIAGGTLILVGVGGYFGVSYLVYEHLSPFVSSQLSNYLSREVRVGEVKSFSFNHITFGKSSVPATTKDPDELSLEEVDINFNPLPVIFQRTLPLEITIVAPNLYLEQDKQGQWIRLKLPKSEEKLPINLDAKVNLKDAKVTLNPYDISRNLEIKAEGSGRYIQAEDEQVQYDLNVALLKSQIQVNGSTYLATGKTLADLTIQRLALAEIVALIPNSPIKLKQGEVNANLGVNFPSTDQIKNTQGKGNINISKIAGIVSSLQVPIQANVALSLQGQKVIIEQLEAKLSTLSAQVTGSIDWEKGYDIKGQVKPFNLGRILKLFSVSLPVKLDGKVQIDLGVSGAITQPVIQGTIKNDKNLIIDKIIIDRFNTNFQTNLEELTLKSLQIVPLAGGEITGNGKITLGLLNALENRKQIRWEKMPLSLNIVAQLPTEKLIKPYVTIPQNVSVGSLNARGNLRGTLTKFRASLDWNTTHLATIKQQKIAGQGQLLWVGDNILVRNTELQTNQGKLLVNGQGNLKQKQWKTLITANNFNLAPFVAIVCQNTPNICPYTDAIQPVRLDTANIRLAGKLDNFALDTLTGRANLGLMVQNGVVGVKSTLAKSNFQADILASSINLNPFLPASVNSLSIPVSLNQTTLNVRGSINDILAQNWNNIKARANLQLNVQNNPINIDGQVSQGLLEAIVSASSINLNPFLPASVNNLSIPISLNQTTVNLRGAINDILAQNWESLKAKANLQLSVQNSPINIDGQVSQGLVEAIINTDKIPLNGFLPNLTIPVNLQQTQVFISSSVKDLLALDLNAINADANLRLGVANSPLNIVTNLNNGLVNTIANLGQFSLNKIFPKLPIDAKLKTTEAVLSTQVNSLIAVFLGDKKDLGDVKATLNLKLAVADGIVQTVTQLQNNQWNSNIVASGLNTTNLLTQFTPLTKYPQLPNTNARLNLSGTVADIFKTQSTIPIVANQILINMGDQHFNAKGNILISNILNTKPIDASANITLKADANLKQIPTTALLTQLSVDRRLLPQELGLSGEVFFQGEITANNILTAPTKPGNIQLNGDINIQDLIVNNRPFDSLLKGTITAGIGEPIALDLRGQNDVIAAAVEPCNLSRCIFPYLPVSFELRQITPGLPSILAQGERKGERFLAQVKNFPLDFLGIVPLKEYGIIAPVKGDLNLGLDVNLVNLSGQGDIDVQGLSIGNLQATSFIGNFAYYNQLAELKNATLTLNKSQYNVQGSLNIATGAIQGDVNINDGRIQDTLTALGNPDIQTLMAILTAKNIPEIEANKLPQYSLGGQNDSLATLVNLLGTIDRKIKAIAQARQSVVVPTQLDITGIYQANLNLQGTLRDPKINFQFQGKNWSWTPQLPYPNIVPPLGLIIRGDNIVPINEITLKASLDQGVIALEPARLRIRDSLFFLEGKTNLINGKIIGNFGVEKFSADTVNTFFRLSTDLNGQLNVQGNLSGTLKDPKIAGNFDFSNASFNARLLNQDITGIFNYAEGRFKLNTDNNSAIQLYASIPYPPLAKNDDLEVALNLDTEALKLVNIFTQDQVTWLDGQGQVKLKATGNLNLDNGFKVKNILVDGQIILADALLASPSIPDTVKANGVIQFNRELINVQQLVASFAESQVTAQGFLPLFVSSSQLKNPLTVTIEKGDINLKDLYKGNIDGQIIVNGSAVKPLIGGRVSLYQGEVFVPKNTATTAEDNTLTPLANQWLSTRNNPKTGLFIPQLNNLQVVLENLYVERSPLYQFNFGGQLIVNGNLTGLNNLRGQGVIELNQGRVSYIDTRFLLNRRHRNVIVFDPSQQILNPYINVQMQTIISDFPSTQLRERSEQRNEIADESLNRVRRVNVTLGIDGRLSQILPNLTEDLQQICQIFPETPLIPEQPGHSKPTLEKLNNCMRSLAIYNNTGNSGEVQGTPLGSPAIQLSSSPPLSEGEIVRLLGNQIFEVVDALQGKNTEQILQYGIVQLAVPSLLQEVLYDVENSIAKGLNITEFRAFPVMEAVYRVDKNGFVTVSYDYNFGEFTVKYQTRF